MRAIHILSVVSVLSVLSLAAQADVFHMGQGLTNLETVLVGDQGNAPDTEVMTLDGTTGYGSVGNSYAIGKYEVTAAQYCDFLNWKAKSDPYALYTTAMTAGYGCNIARNGSSGSYTYSVTEDWANRPVNMISYWDACRFANWLHNGQQNGDTETGAYTLNGYMGEDGRTIQRNPAARWFLPSENEWYKAAYFKGGRADAGYWDYPTRSDSTPGNDITNPDLGNNANFNQLGYTLGSPYFRANVGEFENSGSAYDTFDQAGNLWEWDEGIGYQDEWSAYRVVRGGSYNNLDYALQASYRIQFSPTGDYNMVGFRVAMVPEPSSLLALACGILALPLLRRRK